MEELRMVSAKSHIGTAETDSEGFLAALERRPAFVGVQGGSVDFGPHYLGAGVSNKSRTRMMADMELIVLSSLHAGARVIVGGVGYSGERSRVDWAVEMLREIAAAHRLSFKLAVIYSDIPRDYLKKRARQEKIRHLELPDSYMTPEDVDASSNIVGMMGLEPFERALSLGADVIFTGRCCDAAIFAAPLVSAGFDRGVAWHMGALMECAGLSCRPPIGSACILGTAQEDGFTLETTSRLTKCTVESIIDHQLYEQLYAYRENFPGGYVDSSEEIYREDFPGRVRVSGTKFVPTPYEVLVYGAGPAGFRSLCIGGIRDPMVTQHCREVEEDVKQRLLRAMGDPSDLRVRFLNYGIDGVLGPYEHRENLRPHEVGVVVDVIAPTQEMATDAAQRIGHLLDVVSYEGRVFGQRNFAFPFSPTVLECGTFYRFTIDHLLPLEDPCEVFPVTLYDVQEGEVQKIVSI